MGPPFVGNYPCTAGTYAATMGVALQMECTTCDYQYYCTGGTSKAACPSATFYSTDSAGGLASAVACTYSTDNGAVSSILPGNPITVHDGSNYIKGIVAIHGYYFISAVRHVTRNTHAHMCIQQEEYVWSVDC